MARKSRKPVAIPTSVEEKSTVFHTALYARLSIEDNGIDGDSIENQIFIIKQYIQQEQDLELTDQFVDNGLTGTNFERPSFTTMMEAVRKGKINCIVVKDLSRFGRNYLETGNFLEKIFPYLAVRFISVTDHFDSLHVGKSDALLVPLKSILHDTYAKDISKKVTTAIDIKKKSGRFMGKIPPYGYVRDEEDRYKLVIHQERDEVVRDILHWRMNGDDSVTIAHRLNDMEVPTQFQIRFSEGFADGKQNALWHGSAITDMLKNPCYIGCLVVRKSSNALYKGKNHTVIPVSEWKLIENTHEPIIDKDTFYQVQNLLEESRLKKRELLEKNAYRQRTENILSSIVRCGVCGGGFHRDGGYFKKDGSLIHYLFGCSNKYIKTGGCTSKTVPEKELLDCVFEACKKQIELLADMDALLMDLSDTVSHDPYYKKLDMVI